VPDAKRQIRTFNTVIEPMQNAQPDGYRRDEEVVGMFGQFFDGRATTCSSGNWYWNLKGTLVKEKLVTWSPSLIVEDEFR
jgi:hypothetical protein